jgi:hypothetical protein
MGEAPDFDSFGYPEQQCGVTALPHAMNALSGHLIFFDEL